MWYKTKEKLTCLETGLMIKQQRFTLSKREAALYNGRRHGYVRGKGPRGQASPTKEPVNYEQGNRRFTAGQPVPLLLPPQTVGKHHPEESG